MNHIGDYLGFFKDYGCMIVLYHDNVLLLEISDFVFPILLKKLKTIGVQYIVGIFMSLYIREKNENGKLNIYTFVLK